MRQSTRSLLVMVIFVLGLGGVQRLSPSTSPVADLSMSWGIENTAAFKEGKEYAPMLIEWKESPKPKRLFFFTGGSMGEDCATRHFKLWDQYQKEYNERSKEGFDAYKKERDPSCAATIQKLAPTLYFDFIANNKRHYVLKEIEVRTIGFQEYAGGGFSNKEAWYDIVLSHVQGTKTYQIDSGKLEFEDTGRVQLRLWSDNYYPKSGWIAPMGAYLIDIRFRFVAEGAEVRVSTGPFQIDV
jgi:hypothetical protein